MRIGWIIGLVFLFVLGAIIGGVMEQTYPGSTERSAIDRLLKPTLGEISNPWEATTAFFTVAGDWVDALWEVLTFDYPFFTGEMVIVRWLFLGISIGVIIAILLAWIRGTPST